MRQVFLREGGVRARMLCWKNNVVIFRVDKLRAILLYEADFNQNNKKLGREIMITAEDFKAIEKEQFGSRAGLMAIDQSLNKRLTYDLM